jgi:hypothetical protein
LSMPVTAPSGTGLAGMETSFIGPEVLGPDVWGPGAYSSRRCLLNLRTYSMSRKSENRFSEKDMRQQRNLEHFCLQ